MRAVADFVTARRWLEQMRPELLIRNVQEAGAIYELLDVLQNFSCDGAVT